jgi:Ca2+-binding EF-hand superfamily protein
VESEKFLKNVEDAKLRGLFLLFDTYGTGKVSSKDFEKVIISSCPASDLIERFRNKVKKGGQRLIRVLEEEF